jgi:hypothetical protein
MKYPQCLTDSFVPVECGVELNSKDHMDQLRPILGDEVADFIEAAQRRLDARGYVNRYVQISPVVER